MRTIKGKRVSDTQADLHGLLKRYGPMPDHALVPLAQHMLPQHPSSSGVRTRRRELERVGLVIEAGTIKTASNREAVVWKAA